MGVKLLILSMANDGEVIFRIDGKQYRAVIDTAHYPEIKKWMYRKPGSVINLIKKHGEVERI